MDLLLEGAIVYDGLGGPGKKARVGIRAGRIEHLGDEKVPADRVVDLAGLALAPGFVDIHAHSDYLPLLDPYGYSKVHDGVVLEVTGNCGMSPFPLAHQEAEQEAREWPGLAVDWRDMPDYLSRLRGKGMGIDRAFLVGHGTLRARVMGYADRPATADELAEMVRLLERNLEAGAVGLSTGLIYSPGRFAPADEIHELARVVKRHGKLYASHIRGEGDTLVEAIAEILEVARVTGVRTQISHLKASKPQNWDKLDRVLGMIEEARAAGADVMADCYPYTATSTSLDAILPGWALEGGKPAVAARCAPGSEARAKLLPYLRDHYPSDYWGRIQLASMGPVGEPEIEGKRLAELAAARGVPPAELGLDLIHRSGAMAAAVYHVLSEDNLRKILVKPWVMVGSDGSARAVEGPGARGTPHPRGFGTFARVLGRYARAEKLLTTEAAVAKMTAMPADRLGLAKRGRIALGCRADLVAFDPARVEDRATFEKPHAYSDGIHGVWIGGVAVIAERKHTGVLAGSPVLVDG